MRKCLKIKVYIRCSEVSVNLWSVRAKFYCIFLGQTKEDGKYPNLAKKCRQWYACSDGEMIQLKMCDEGTVFDVQR